MTKRTGWTAEEDELVKCLIAKGPAVPGCWASLGAVLGRGESSCRARGQYWRNALGLHVKGQAKQPPPKSATVADFMPAPKRAWWALWRKH